MESSEEIGHGFHELVGQHEHAINVKYDVVIVIQELGGEALRRGRECHGKTGIKADVPTWVKIESGKKLSV
jgi:hypothetical protein